MFEIQVNIQVLYNSCSSNLHYTNKIRRLKANEQKANEEQTCRKIKMKEKLTRDADLVI